MPPLNPAELLTDRETDAAMARAEEHMPAGIQPERVIDVSDTAQRVAPSTPLGDTSRLCPLCGIDINMTQPVSVTDRDKEGWLRMICGAERFRRAYTCYGGRVSVTYRTRTAREDSLIAAALAKEVHAGTLIGNSFQLGSPYMRREAQFNLLLSIESLAVADVDSRRFETVAAKTPEALTEALDTFMGDMASGMLDVLLTTLGQFERLCRQLMFMAYDPDFTAPTERAT
jgi:hypothetical protein